MWTWLFSLIYNPLTYFLEFKLISRNKHQETEVREMDVFHSFNTGNYQMGTGKLKLPVPQPLHSPFSCSSISLLSNLKP